MTGIYVEKVGQRLILHFINRSVLFYSHKDYVFHVRISLPDVKIKDLLPHPTHILAGLLFGCFYLIACECVIL